MSILAPAHGTGGRILFLSATIHYSGVPLQTHVAAAKAGVDALSNALAIEMGPRGVTSNVVAPGPIFGTEGMERLARKEDIAASMRRIPSGRYGWVKEIADATVYLFSESGNFVNGSTVVVDGGAWRTNSADPGAGFVYPEYLLDERGIEGVKTGRKAKL